MFAPDPLTPRLTALDTAVLEAVREGPCRLSTIGSRIWDRWAVGRTTTLEVLRGLEHLGYIENRHGWWRDARP